MKVTERVLWAGVLVAALGLAPARVWAQAQAPSAAEGSQTLYEGFTMPSEKRELNFNTPGIVRKVQVKEGDAVKAGQELLVQDERVDLKSLEAAQVDVVEAKAEVEYQKAELALKKSVLERKEKLYNEERSASQQEVEEARLDRDLSQTRLTMAEEKCKQKEMAVEVQKVKVDLLHLASTIDGIVQHIGMKEGEVADPNNGQKPAIVVVQNDPLKVEVKLPTPIAGKLRPGQSLEVRYPDSQDWQKARIAFFDPVADAGSGTRVLHLEMPNPSKRESGWVVSVRIPEGAVAQAPAPASR